MTGFIVRVDLHGDGVDYEQLRKWMQGEGFTLAITGAKKRPFKLPKGMFYGQSDQDAKALRDHLRDDAPWCGSLTKPSVLVIAYSELAWSLDALT